MRRSENLAYAAAFVALVLAPLYVGAYDLSLLGRFLAMGILAMGICLVWGNAGILPLGQGLFFGLGGYALAMHLKLAALSPGDIPDFMQWNGLDSLPWLWIPFKSGIFAIVAFLLACIGIYGVMAYLVVQRTREIGIRLALGAEPKDVLRVVMGQGARLALAGAAIGTVAALGLTRLMSSLLYGVSATDPGTFAVVSLILAAVAFVASYIPARKATRVDPIAALRYE